MSYPVLADAFFHDHRPQPEFFTRWKNHGPWGPEFVPLYEWSGLLFVGTTGERSFPVKPDWRVVKADPTHLQALWQEFDSGGDTVYDHEPPGAPDLKTLTSIPVPPPPPREEFEGSLTPLPEPSAPKAPAKPTPQPAPKPMGAPAPAATKPASPAAMKAPANEPNSEWQSLWSLMTASFGHGMILLVQDQQAKPWKWDPSLHPVAQQTYSLDVASPLRIVNRTLKSFHGPVSPNEITTRLFSDWNEGVDPEHLTVCPIMQRDTLTGFVVAWGDHSANTKENLLSMENAAKRVAAIFESRPDVIRAA